MKRANNGPERLHDSVPQIRHQQVTHPLGGRHPVSLRFAISPDFFVNLDVFASGRVVIEPALCFPHDAGNLARFYIGRQIVKVHCLIDRPAQTFRVEVLEDEAIARIAINVQVLDGVVQPARIMDDRQRSKFWTDHLW